LPGGCIKNSHEQEPEERDNGEAEMLTMKKSDSLLGKKNDASLYFVSFC
jgi:hypothetical protein